MDNNELSFESIFAKGMGISANDTSVLASQSEERFDGDFDVMFADISKSEEDLNFIETFGKMESVNTKAKLDMLNKINKAYGSCHRGIENYCREQSLEADSAAVVSNDKSETTSKVNVDTMKKRANWLKRVLSAVGDILKKIWHAIVNIFKKLAAKIKSVFAKDKANGDKNLIKFVDNNAKNIAKLQIAVDKVCDINNTSSEEFSRVVSTLKADGPNVTYIMDGYGNLTMCSAAIKMLSQCGKIVLKVSQKLFKDITKLKIVAPSKFDEFCKMYESAANILTEAYKDFYSDINGKKGTKVDYNKLGEKIYKTYDIVSQLVQKTIGFKALSVPRTEFTNPGKSTKRVCDTINTLSKGISDTYTNIDQNDNLFKNVAKDLFGVEVIEQK